MNHIQTVLLRLIQDKYKYKYELSGIIRRKCNYSVNEFNSFIKHSSIHLPAIFFNCFCMPKRAPRCLIYQGLKWICYVTASRDHINEIHSTPNTKADFFYKTLFPFHRIVLDQWRLLIISGSNWSSFVPLDRIIISK